MKLTQKKQLTDHEKIQISGIWNNEYPKTLHFSDSGGFDTYLNALSDPVHYILENDTHEILAWACKFIRDHEKWFAIIIDEQIHGKGKGTEILNAIKEKENNLSGWVIDKETNFKTNGEMYKSPLDFYLKNDFKVTPETRLENEKMSAVKIIWKK